MNTVLGLDSAGKTAGVAIVRGGVPVYEAVLNGGLTHSATLLPLCRDALAAAGLQAQDIDGCAVAAGPGSFTGLRIGLATVKGMALAAGTPCAGVSTLEALCWGVPVWGSVLCALDARRGEVYWAAFRVQQGPAGARVQRLTPDASGPAASLAGALDGLEGPVTLLGDGAHLVAAAFPGRGLRLPPAFFRTGRAVGVCLAALAAGPEAFGPAEGLVPLYHRLSQAQRERAARLGLSAGEV